MEITNHAVMPGETLDQIASRYNSTVAQLRQLNPFITNPDNVKVGWNLSVPKSAQAAATPAAQSPAAPEAPAQATSEPATQCSAEDLVELDPVKDAPDSASKTFKPHAPPCSKKLPALFMQLRSKSSGCSLSGQSLPSKNRCSRWIN
ncbi:LysM peptidoglycan-binding domain-containing protein [Pseudomonas baetica]|uniref:LysM peptidoglycan-binding domain-containing protein n=1 Tax=Pseudomonas baetica TaxID=674054 RepID=UPI001EDEEE0A|nr:LysM domain-containing protein [Pseudomonas baetica]